MKTQHEQRTDAVPPDALSEDAAMALLSNRDVSSEEIEALASNRESMRSRKVLLAIARHIRTPRRIAIPLVRQLFVFELMQLALTPAIAADIKRLAEDLIVGKVASTTLGERLTLAKQGSSRVAAALIGDTDIRVRDAALNNPRLTEMYVVRALMRQGVPRSLVDAVRQHSKWRVRMEVRRALEAIDNPRVSR